MDDMVAKGRVAVGGKPRLSAAERELLRADAKCLTYPELSAKYGVTERTVGRIITGR
jgi:hypothetical protein